MGAWLFMAALTSPVWVQLGIEACRAVRSRIAGGVSPDPDLPAPGEV